MITADLNGKAVLVTGASSGIGLMAVETFARCGAKVALNHLADDPRGAEQIARLLAQGLDVIGAPGDVSQVDGAGAMVTAAIDQLGRLDVLINNAGTSNTVEPVPFEDLDAMTEAFWQRILSTNLIGAFRCARAAAPVLVQSKGAIVSTASVAGLGRRGSSIAYSASKAGLINLTQSLAKALAPHVRVNAVAPGLVNTPWTRPWPAERKRRSIEQSLLARMVEPQDVAQTMLFLACQDAITGQTIAVDCGMGQV
jgi:3-oxoacyl-[acyl-carrier protein] reductase